MYFYWTITILMNLLSKRVIIMYHSQQNKFDNQRCKIVRKTSVNCNTVRKRDRSSKFDLGYYEQVNSLQVKSCVALKKANKHLWGVTFILLGLVQGHCIQNE